MNEKPMPSNIFQPMNSLSDIPPRHIFTDDPLAGFINHWNHESNYTPIYEMDDDYFLSLPVFDEIDSIWKSRKANSNSEVWEEWKKHELYYSSNFLTEDAELV